MTLNYLNYNFQAKQENIDIGKLNLLNRDRILQYQMPTGSYFVREKNQQYSQKGRSHSNTGFLTAEQKQIDAHYTNASDADQQTHAQHQDYKANFDRQFITAQKHDGLKDSDEPNKLP